VRGLLSVAAALLAAAAPVVAAQVPPDAPAPVPPGEAVASAPDTAAPPPASAPSRLESEPAGWTDVMPGPDLAGWTRQAWPVTSPMGPPQWSIDATAGTLVCDGTGGHDWLRLDRELGDAVFHVEWRFVPPPAGPAPAEGAPGPAEEPAYNAGVLVRTAADQSIWHQAQVGGVRSGYLFGRTLVGGTVRRVNLAGHVTDHRVRPPGEWNTYEVTARGSTISLWVNGAVTSEMTVDVPRGHFGLEGEGHRVEFRNLRLKLLE
jgi:hypothetical protein